MQQEETSQKKQPSLRLVDSSIWIAFDRIGMLDLLLSLPDLGVSRGVVGELRGGLRDAVQHLLVEGIGAMSIDEEPAATVACVLAQHGISMQDAAQAAYAAVHYYDRVCLYMRDTDAEIAGGRIGADIRDHHRLVEDMLEVELIDREGARSLSDALATEFRPARR